MSEEVTLNQLMQAVTETTGITMAMLQSRDKRLDICMARGVYYLIAKEMGIHPNVTSTLVRRSRSACIIVSKQYKGYLESGDKQVRTLYEKVKRKLYATE